MAGPKISQQSILVPGVPKVSDAHASGQPKNVKENVVHQSRPPSSIAPWSSPDAHMWCSHCWCFQQWSAVAWAPRPRCGYAAPIHGDFSYLSIRTSFNFEAVWATVAHLFYPTTQEAFAHHMHQQALTLPLVHHCSFLGPLFIDAIHCRLGPLHRSALFWSSRLAISNSNLPSFPPSNTSTLGTALHLLRVYPYYLQVT